MHKVIMVDWLDAHTEDSWNPPDVAKEMCPLIVTSVGFVLAEDEQKIVLSAMVSDHAVSMVQCIPAGCIVKREVLNDI